MSLHGSGPLLPERETAEKAVPPALPFYLKGVGVHFLLLFGMMFGFAGIFCAIQESPFDNMTANRTIPVGAPRRECLQPLMVRSTRTLRCFRHGPHVRGLRNAGTDAPMPASGTELDDDDDQMLRRRLDYISSFYHCFTTTLTVGYGREALVYLSSETARLVTGVYILISVSALAAVTAKASQLYAQREALKRHSRCLQNTELTPELIEMLSRGGEAVDKTEFVIGMLAHLEVVHWHEADPFIQMFHRLDKDGNGKLDRHDLEMNVTTDPSEPRASAAQWPRRSLAEIVAATRNMLAAADLMKPRATETESEVVEGDIETPTRSTMC